MKVRCAAQDGPLFEPVGVVVSDLQPFEPITLSLSFRDDGGVLWASRATFAADHNGEVSTDTHPAQSGTYSGVDPHGLFWSAYPTNHETLLQDVLNGAPGTLAPAIEPLAPYCWHLTITTSSGSTTPLTIARRRKLTSTRELRPPSPMQGLLFEPDVPNGASVVVLGGSEGGVFPARAALLTASGFRTLALAYFQHDGLPDIDRNLPLEYFHSALQWLKSTSTGRIGLIGVSRGSEAAQLTALQWPELVDALILWVPSHMVNCGLDLAGGSDFRTEHSAMWTLSETPIKGVNFLEEDLQNTEISDHDFRTLNGRRYADEFERAWQAALDERRIPIENYKGPVLSIAGTEDALWPSALGAEEITSARTPQTGPRHLAIYDNAGHLIGTPNEPRPFPWLMHWHGGYMGIDNGFCAYGGTREGAALAARQSWKKQTDFLRKYLT
ncbi:MAG: acyl-CoA thioesterase/bile acid-CoA:amino acid N-acyltransferase family protein [Pseudomonadota bacterium]